MRQVTKTKLPKLARPVAEGMDDKCKHCPNNEPSGSRSEYCKLVSQGKTGFCFRM